MYLLVSINISSLKSTIIIFLDLFVLYIICTYSCICITVEYGNKIMPMQKMYLFTVYEKGPLLLLSTNNPIWNNRVVWGVVSAVDVVSAVN